MTSGGFSEYEASRNRSEPSSRSLPIQHSDSCAISVLPGSPLAVTYRFPHSPSFCFFSDSRSLVFEGTFPLNSALRMVYYPHNPQSHQLAQSIIASRPRASGPTTGPLCSSRVFSLARSLFPLLSVFVLYDVAFILYCRFFRISWSVCGLSLTSGFAKFGRISALF